MKTKKQTETVKNMDSGNTGAGWWVGFVLEAALIVFSVLLALAVNEWRAERARAQKAQTAIDAIHSELEANREEFQGCNGVPYLNEGYPDVLSKARFGTAYGFIISGYL